MFDAFVTLFTQADALFFVLFSLSILLFVLEVFIPSFGIAGIAGILMTMGTIVERCITGNNSTTQVGFYIFWCIFLIAISCSLVKMIYVLIRNRRKVKNTMTVKGNKVPSTEQGNPDYSFLLGKSGVVVADLKPSGKAEFDEKVYDVTTTKDYIFAGSRVRVKKVYASKIVVEKIV